MEKQICLASVDSEKLSLVSNYRIINNSYLYFKKFVVGSGSFGKVLYGMNIERTQECAIKFEKNTVKKSLIDDEINIIKDLKGGVGIPKILWHGQHDDYKIMIMELLGPSLDKFFKICHKKFTLETTVIFGIEMIKRIEYVHSKGYLHRDIKPNNFLLGKFSREMTSDRTIYIIDFGLSKSYIDPCTGTHYTLKDDRRFVGTPRYASLNTHLGVRQSRRDDLESIIYILIYFLKSELPWQGVKAKTKSEKKRKIMRKKKSVSSTELCLNIPKVFNTCMDYIKGIKFEDKPNYKYICDLLSTLSISCSLDWEWNIMFLSSKRFFVNEKVENDSLNDSDNNRITTKYKQYYYKLYEGYPVPKYEDFLGILDKRDSCFINDNIQEINKNEIDNHKNISRDINIFHEDKIFLIRKDEDNLILNSDWKVNFDGNANINI